MTQNTSTMSIKKTPGGLAILSQEQVTNLLENTDKGVLLIGDVGKGKTYIFKQKFNKNVVLEPNKAVITANTIVGLYCEGGMQKIKEVFKYQLEGRMRLVIDDIGTESQASHFGTKIDIVEWLILECYAAGSAIFATTNLSIKALEERYGKRVVDRLKESCYVVVLEGKSYRQESFESNQSTIESLINPKVKEEVLVESNLTPEDPEYWTNDL